MTTLNIGGEERRQDHLCAALGDAEAAEWYEKTAAIYDSAATDRAERGNREWADVYKQAAADCRHRAQRLREGSSW